MAEFIDEWTACFGKAVPLGYRLRQAFKNRWLRIHSIKDSKRYADSETERATLLQRANQLAADLLGEGQACWIVSSHPADGREITSGPVLTRDSFSLTHSHDWQDGAEAQEDQTLWQSFVARTYWQSGRFDSVLLRLADEQEAFTLWFSPERNAVFAPYAGGIDVIAGSSAEIETLVHRYRDWMSTREDFL